MCEETFHVFCEDVGFDVDGIVGIHGADVGVRVSEGNDGDVGDAFVPARDGEADAVDCDGAFFRDVAALIFGHPDGEPPVVAFGDEARYAADAVNVSLHEVAAQARVCRERALEVDEMAGFFFAEGSTAQSFAGKVRGKMVLVEFDDGEAAAVDCDAIAEFHLRGERAGAFKAYAETAAIFSVFERFNFSDVFGDSCKHRENILGLQNLDRKFVRIYFSAQATSQTSARECAPWARRLSP